MNQVRKDRMMVSAFLTGIVDQVREILKDEKNSFYFPRQISRTDKNSRCMVGWLSTIAPDLIVDDGENVRARGLPGTVFRPWHLGFPISPRMFDALTVAGMQYIVGEEQLPRLATFEQVAAVWNSIAKRVEDGEFDQDLLETRLKYISSAQIQN